MTAERQDVYSRITNKIIADLEQEVAGQKLQGRRSISASNSGGISVAVGTAISDRPPGGRNSLEKVDEP